MRTQGDGSSDGRDREDDAAARLARDTAQMARHELLVLESEARAALRRIGSGGVLLGAAGACAVLALRSAHETLLRSLEPVLPGARAPALLGGAYAAGAVALALAARERLCAAARAPEEGFVSAEDPDR
ncbi:phage holin family protein [Streptomyces sp. NPDC048664]|uniref:phage holin family protein n=1 Tax=Streptomyces sp. NPDC048664 TaxID=3154505 RepID=UPI00343499C6